jgi:hypothetical protein
LSFFWSGYKKGENCSAAGPKISSCQWIIGEFWCCLLKASFGGSVRSCRILETKHISTLIRNYNNEAHLFLYCLVYILSNVNIKTGVGLTFISRKCTHCQTNILYSHKPWLQNWLELRVMLFNTTFNNISVISWRPVLLVEETRVPGENHWSVVRLTHLITLCCIEYTSPLAGFELTMLVVIDTDCVCSCNSNYHTFTTTTTPTQLV